MRGSRPPAMSLRVLATLAIFVGAKLQLAAADNATQDLTETSKLQPTEFLLPTSLKPFHYFVRLQPFVNSNFSIHGYTEITFFVVKPTTMVTLHIKDIVTKNETTRVYEVGKKNDTLLKILSQKYDKTREFYVATLNGKLQEGKQYVISMEFIATLNEKLNGFYRSSYVDANGTQKWLGVTQFQPTDARRAFPCFDEPALKADFSIELVREKGMSSISNMPKISTIPQEGQDGWFVDQFQRSQSMSTYLVAFLVSDFDHVDSTISDDTLFRVWARRDLINQTEYALQKGHEILKFFESYFNITYPLPKADMVAIPDFSAGAMENWGLITYRETYLLHDPKSGSDFTKKSVANTIAHELAHQWFGNLVTPYWWTDLWLNEGFATYMAVVGLTAVEPSFKQLESFILSPLTRALKSDSLENSHPISVEVGHPNEIHEIFDAISYSKGASVIRMMDYFLTPKTFKNGVSNYLKKYAFSDAKQDDLWHELTLQATSDQTLPKNVTVKDIMDTWTLQMGYPVITVTVHNDSTATLTQKKFKIFKNTTSANSTLGYKWWVPITFTTQGKPDFSNTNPKVWMKPTEASKTISEMPSTDEWVIFNLQNAGFYRVNYDTNNWNNIINQLNKNHTVFPSITRAQLIGDSFQLARADMLPYSVPLQLVSYLHKEEEYVPLQAGDSEIGFLHGFIKYTNHSEEMKNYFLSLYAPQYDRTGFIHRAEESYFDQAIRIQTLYRACDLEYQPCLDRAKELYSEWMLNPSSESLIAPTLRRTVYCMGIKEGGEKEWNFGLQQYQASEIAVEKEKLLSALGCTSNNTIKLKYLDMAFQEEGPIRKHYVTTVLSSIARDKQSSLLVWNYVTENWDRIFKYIGSKSRSMQALLIGARHIKTDEELKKFDAFIATKEELQGPGSRSLRQGRESLVETIEWLRSNTEVVTDWLAKTRFTTVKI